MVKDWAEDGWSHLKQGPTLDDLNGIPELGPVAGGVIRAVKAAEETEEVARVVIVAQKTAKVAQEGVEVTEAAGNTAVRFHHSWPMYLGGPKKQALVPLSKNVHDAFHSGLDKILPRQKGTAFYQNLPQSSKEQVLQDLEDFTKAFDEKNGTTLVDSMKQNGFPSKQ